MVDIKDISGKVLFSTPINEGSKRKYTLMKEDCVTLKFSLDNPIYFKLGDGIDNEIGLFELIDLYKPTFNDRTGAYDYELRLDAYYMKWKNKKFFYTPEDGSREASWSLTADLGTHSNVLLKNLTALGYTYRGQAFKVIIDNTVPNEARFIDYQNMNLIDALTKMAEVFECEWWVEGCIIKFGRCENANPPIDFTFDDNVAKMSRKDSQSTFATRVYAFGSERNIPRSYRKKLEFDVKTVSGRDISDTGRVLESKFFPVESYNHSSFKTRNDHISFSSHGQLFTTAHPIKIIAFQTESIFMRKGMYKFIPESVRLLLKKGSAGFIFTGDLNLDIKIIYTLNGVEKSVLILSKTTTTNAGGSQCDLIVSETESFTLEDDVTDFRFSLESSIEYIGSTGINYEYEYWFISTIQRVAVSVNSLITFQSGLNTGKTFNCIVNPDFKEGVGFNLIRLPEGTTASIGDKYTLDNIIKSRVPGSYFTASSSELTAQGVVTKRLMLPADTPYIDAFPNMNTEDIVEEIVIFDDVYPSREGVMSEVDKGEKIFVKDDKGINTEEFYYEYTFKDVGLRNFSASYKLEGVDLEITFSTESKHLIGRKFVVDFVSSDDTGAIFRIKAIQEGARYIPDETLCPVNGDKYVLAGYDVDLVSTTLIPEAEAKLKSRALEYIEKLKIDPSVYDCTLNSSYAYNGGKGRFFKAGERVNLINPAYFEAGRQSRIIGYELNLDIPYDSPIYIVGESAPYSRVAALESKVDSLTYQGKTFFSSYNPEEVIIIKKTLGEVKAKLDEFMGFTYIGVIEFQPEGGGVSIGVKTTCENWEVK